MAERVTSVPLEMGLYVLRYVQASSAYGAPHVFVRPSPGSEGVVSVISPPGSEPGSIPAPGGCVVVRAERSSSLHITIHSRQANGGTDAELRLESLGGEREENEFAQGAMLPPATQVSTPRLEVVGHVSRRGDVKVEEGRWVAGPDSPAPIEGLEMRVGGQVGGLALEYQVQIGGPGGAWTAWMTGGYAGTRGQSRPLLGARVRLVGPSASQFQIEAEALFLGATVKRHKGQAIEMISGSGVDPLVGLKFTVNSPASAVSAPALPHSSTSPNADPTFVGRVRVFRSAGLR